MLLCFAIFGQVVSTDVSLFIFSCLDLSKKCDIIWTLKEATEQEVVMIMPQMKIGQGSTFFMN